VPVAAAAAEHQRRPRWRRRRSPSSSARWSTTPPPMSCCWSCCGWCAKDLRQAHCQPLSAFCACACICCLGCWCQQHHAGNSQGGRVGLAARPCSFSQVHLCNAELYWRQKAKLNMSRRHRRRRWWGTTSRRRTAARLCVPLCVHLMHREPIQTSRDQNDSPPPPAGVVGGRP